MAFPIGTAKILTLKVQSALGTAATGGAATGQIMRRISAPFNLKKQTYTSNELRPSMQRSGVVHGVRSVDATYEAELSPGSSPEILQAVLRRDFTATAAITGLSITIAASGNFWTLTRATGDWLASAARVGMGCRLTAGTFTAQNANNNFQIVSITTLVLTVAVMNGTALVAEGPIASATLTFPGKSTYMPTTGHTKKYFTVEEWFPENSRSHLHKDCRFGTFDIDLPGTGIAKISASVMGRDTTRSGSRYFTSPTAAGTTLPIQSVNGTVVLNGGKMVTLTNMKVAMNGGLSNGDPVVGSNLYPDIFDGQFVSAISFGSYFVDSTVADLFDAGTEVGIMGAFVTSTANNAEFITFYMPRAVLTTSDFNDVAGAIMGSHNAEASENSVTTAGSEATTMQIHDSLAP